MTEEVCLQSMTLWKVLALLSKLLELFFEVGAGAGDFFGGGEVLRFARNGPTQRFAFGYAVGIVF